MSLESHAPLAPITGEALSGHVDAVRAQVAQAFVGQGEVLDQVLCALLAGGHVLLEGVPGLGKTLLVRALATALDCHFARVQFTPDLMPSDISGHAFYDPKTEGFKVRRGPVFTNLLLADEINRAPAKTQAALLEVMQEVQVTIDGETLSLEPPFMTLATQNPVEHEGTYPLPEAQLDRFLMKILIDYPGREAECEIVSRAASEAGKAADRSVVPICGPQQVIAAQSATSSVQVMPEVVAYAVAIAQATRDSRAIALGAGTRGAISLVKIGKAFAVLQGRGYVIPDDIKSAALPVLRHRVQLTPEVAISGQNVDEVLRSIVEGVPAPRQ